MNSSSASTKKRNGNLWVLPSWLLLGLIVIFGGDGFFVPFVSAETWTQIEVDIVLDPEGKTGGIMSTPFALDIHGSGYLNFAELSYESEQTGITLDAAVFFLKEKPDDVLKWQTDTIGALTDNGNTQLCCRTSAQKLTAANGGGNICTEEQIGQLIINENDKNILMVEHRPLNLTGENVGMWGVVGVDETEHMALVFGYCDDAIDDTTPAATLNDPAVHISGTMIWVSYESGMTVVLYLVMTAFAVVMTVGYHTLMKIHVASRIEIEEWILKVLCLCSFSLGLQTLLIATEVYGNNELVFLEFLSDFANSVAAAASRCLYLVLALGLGVITTNLSTPTKVVVGFFLGSYVLGYFAIDSMDFTARGPLIAMFENIVLVLDLVFLVWIPSALCSTMGYLKRNGQDKKLLRYRWILKIYFLMIFLSVFQIFLFFWDMIKNAGRNYDLESVREGNKVIHLFILACITYLWKPNPSQQQYSTYVLLEDNEDNENTNVENTAGITDLELTEVDSPMGQSLDDNRYGS